MDSDGTLRTDEAMSQPILLIVERAAIANRVRDAFQASGHQVTIAVDLDAAVTW